MKRKYGIYGLAGLTFAAVSMLTGCALLPQEEEPQRAPIVETQEPYEYRMDMVKRETIYETVLLYGVYQATDGVQLSFPQNGVVAEVYVEAGDEVKEGDVLAILYFVPELQERADALQEQINSDQKEYDWLALNRSLDERELSVQLDYGYISQKVYDEGMEAVEERYHDRMQSYEDSIYLNQLRLDQILEEMQTGILTASQDGIIRYVQKNLEGATVRGNARVIDIVGSAKGAFVVNTEYAYLFHVGDEYQLSTASAAVNYDTVVSEVTEDTVYFELASQDVTVNMEARARCLLVLDTRENVLTLSYSSIRYNKDKAYVYYIDENGIRSMKEITVGMRGSEEGTSNMQRIEIIDGLELGDIVINK